MLAQFLLELHSHNNHSLKFPLGPGDYTDKKLQKKKGNNAFVFIFYFFTPMNIQKSTVYPLTAFTDKRCFQTEDEA